MREISAIEGFVVASVVDPLTGTVLASAPSAEDESVQVTASGAAELMHALAVMTSQLATGAMVEDLIVTTTDRYHFVRVVEPARGETALLVVTVDRARSRLAVALREVRDAGTICAG
jgi:fructose-1,6-bisphosphatase/sedoheptulose 1,7-bisphosphatase-like protein